MAKGKDMRQVRQHRPALRAIGLGLLLALCAGCVRPVTTATLPSSTPGPATQMAVTTRRVAAPGTPLMELPTNRPPATARPTGTPTSPPTQTPTPLPGPTSEPVLLGSPPPAPLAWLDENGTLWWTGTDGVPRYPVDHVTSYAWSPEGSRIALLRDRDLWLLDLDEPPARLLLRNGQLVQAAWSPTGDRLAVVEILEGPSECVVSEIEPTRILLVDVPAGTFQVLFDGPLPEGGADAVWQVRWSPDGRTLYAMGCAAVTSASLLALAVEDGSALRITSGAWRYVILPEQGTLLVAQHRYTDTGSHRVAAEYGPGGALRREWPDLENMLFSPGPGGAMAFTEEPLYPHELTGTLYLRQPDGVILTTSLVLDEDTRWEALDVGVEGVMDWSPDGLWLAAQKAGRIWLVSARSGEARPLVAGHRPRWRPGIVSP
jgi:hypothetical protein